MVKYIGTKEHKLEAHEFEDRRQDKQKERNEVAIMRIVDCQGMNEALPLYCYKTIKGDIVTIYDDDKRKIVSYASGEEEITTRYIT